MTEHKIDLEKYRGMSAQEAQVISRQAQGAAERYESNVASLYRGDGQPIYSDAEHGMLEESYRNERDQAFAELAQKAERLEQQAVVTREAMAGSDPTDYFDTETVQEAGARREFVQEEAEVQEKIPEVEQELRTISGPTPVIHDLQVWQRQFRGVNQGAAAPLTDVNRIGNEIQNAATASASYFQGVLEERRSESMGWQTEVDWSDAGRAAIRNAGNMPGPSRVQTIKADPEVLERKGATL